MTWGWVDSSSSQSHVFLPFCWWEQKIDFSWEERKTVKDERDRQFAKINRWIKTTADVSLFSIPLSCIHLPFSLSSLSSSDAARKPKLLTNSCLGASSIFICTRSKKKKKRKIKKKKKKQPPAALHLLLNTLSLPHSCKAALHRWAKLKCLCPGAEEHPGPKPLCNQFSYFASVSSSNFLFLQLAFALSTHTASLLHWSVFAVMLP